MRTTEKNITGSVVIQPITIHDRINLRSYLKSKFRFHWRDELDTFAFRNKNSVSWSVPSIGSGDLYSF